MKKSLKIIGSVILVALLTIAIIAIVFVVNNPVRLLPLPERGLISAHKILEPHNGRYMEHITLESGKLGKIGFVLSLPSMNPKEKIPVLVVLGGLGRGEDNVRYIRYGGNNAIMGYDWPMPVRFPEGREFLLQAISLYRQVMTVPGQVVSAMRWLQGQPWVDTKRISLLGFSFGALAAPSVQALAEEEGINIGWTILAYGGTPFETLFLANSSMKPEWLRQTIAPSLDILLYPLRPEVHLPRLKGRFLVLEGLDDEFIPEEARKNLRDAVPEPKTVLTFPGTHIGVGPESLKLLQEIMFASQKWLTENEAVNP